MAKKKKGPTLESLSLEIASVKAELQVPANAGSRGT
jgi:hypothetical protein